MHIKHIELMTRNLPEQRGFYHDVLGLSVIKETAEEFTVQVGASALTFREAPADWNGVYHFAFNIPPSQYVEAKAWLSARVDLVTDAEGNAEIFFPHWNAHALYFRDKGENIAELIARHTLSLSSEKPFDKDSLLNISEIGIVTDSVPAMVQRLQQVFDLAVYRGEINEEFTAVGDENGLFIVVRDGRPWFLIDLPAEPAPVTVEIKTAAAESSTVTFGVFFDIWKMVEGDWAECSSASG